MSNYTLSVDTTSPTHLRHWQEYVRKIEVN